jgi:predicted negative regulator of RcsB-dependent stress response
MMRLLKQLEDMMVAITFSEAGEYDKANQELGVYDAHEQDAEIVRLSAFQNATGKSIYKNNGKQT